MDSALPIEFGFFGKIPAVGDFVSRNLRHSQIAHADQWFQQGLSTLQTQVEIWRDNYLVAPVWRFLIPRGHWADTALCGIIMPSIDRVGRYFPLAVWGDLPAAMERDALGLCAQLSAVAAYLPRVLREYTQTDALQEALSSCVRSAAIYPYALPSVVRDFISTGDCSVWWAEKAPTMPFYEIIHHGRPDATLFIRLFHGFHGIGKVIQ